jgi:hypothetical protein
MANDDQASAPSQLDQPEPEWSADEAAESAAAEVHAILTQEAEMEASWAYSRSDFPHHISAAVRQAASGQAPPLPGQDPAAQASPRRQRPARSRAR